MTIPFLKDRLNDFNVASFFNEMFLTSKLLGKYECKIQDCPINTLIIPVLQKKEAISSMWIEGTQTTISDLLEFEITEEQKKEKENLEAKHHSSAIVYGFDYLRMNKFSHEFIKKIHSILLTDLPTSKDEVIGDYKKKNNYIYNSIKKVVFSPPSYNETVKYMTELIDFMNEEDDINPLIKAAIIHSQFESIHPFENGNGRVGRLLINFYLFKANVINFPIFYISEAFNSDKTQYYQMLTSTREGTYDKWIKFFLIKCISQTNKHIEYMTQLDSLYKKSKKIITGLLSSVKSEEIISSLFTHPVVNSASLAKNLGVTTTQARRYLNILEENQILISNDKKRGKVFYFYKYLELLNII